MRPTWSNGVRKAGSAITATRNGRFTCSIAATTSLAQWRPEDWASLLRFEKRMANGENVGGLNNFANLLAWLFLTVTVESGPTPQRFASSLWMSGFPMPVRSACLDLAQVGERKLGSSTTAARPRSDTLETPIPKSVFLSNRITYLDNWTSSATNQRTMVNLSMRNKLGLASGMAAWHKASQGAPYFAHNNMLEYTLALRFQQSGFPTSILIHPLILSSSEIHIAD